MGTTFTTIEADQPRIYVACLASYNYGILHGAWIDAKADAWSMWDSIRSMLAASPIAEAEEFAIHDYEGFGGVKIAEYAGIETVAAIAAFLEEHGELGALTLAHFCGDLDEARQAIEDRYLGCYASLADYMQEITEGAITIPETLRYYVDWEAMARDAAMSGDLFTIEVAYGQTHVFAGY